MRRQSKCLLPVAFCRSDPDAPRWLIGESGCGQTSVARRKTTRVLLCGKAACSSRTQAIELMRQVGLPTDSASRRPFEFSGRQRQRLCGHWPCSPNC
jgi:ABC-type oligopeptide transport system ATPase subunit